MPQFIVSYHGSGDDELQVTADNADHAMEVFDKESINLWALDIEITDVEFVPNEPERLSADAGLPTPDDSVL